MINNKILQKAIDTYGADAQFRMAMEECAELIQAICKLYRNIDEAASHKGQVEELARSCVEGTHILANVIEEIADVEIMIAQLKMILHCEQHVSDMKQAKIDRLVERLEVNT